MTAHSDISTWRNFIAASKKKKGPLYTRFVNRNAAIPLTYLFWKLGLHPNAVSSISFLVTHTALLLLILWGSAITLVIAAIVWFLLALGFVLDACDGQLARVSGRTSALGEWLDHSLDIAKVLNFNMALSFVMISSAIAADQPLTLPFIAAFLNLLSQPAHFFVINMKEKLLAAPGSETRSFGEGSRTGLISNVIITGADYGLFILIVLLLPRQDLFVPAYLAYGLFYMFIFVAHFARTSRMIARKA